MLRPLLLVAACAGAAPAQSVEINLRSGESLYGELRAQTAQDVVVEQSLWYDHHGLGHIERHLNRGAIVRVQLVTSLEQLYQQRLAQMPATYAGRYAFVRWCLDRGLVTQALEQVRRLIADSPADPVAHELAEDTGYVLDHDTWVTQATYGRTHGLVVYGGVLMTPQEATLHRTIATTGVLAREADAHLAEATAQEAAALDDLREATVAYQRALRHQRAARKAEEDARWNRMSPDDRADEEVRRRFDEEHHRTPPATPDDKEVVEARKDLDAAQRRDDALRADITDTTARRDRARAEHDQARQELAAFLAAQAPPPGLPQQTASDDAPAAPAGGQP